MITFRETVLAAAEALGKRREHVRVVALPVLPLRLLATALGALGLLWPAAAQLAGGLRFMLYASTHDSGRWAGGMHAWRILLQCWLEVYTVVWLGLACKAPPCPHQ